MLSQSIQPAIFQDVMKKRHRLYSRNRSMRQVVTNYRERFSSTQNIQAACAKLGESLICRECLREPIRFSRINGRCLLAFPSELNHVVGYFHPTVHLGLKERPMDFYESNSGTKCHELLVIQHFTEQSKVFPLGSVE